MLGQSLAAAATGLTGCPRGQMFKKLAALTYGDSLADLQIVNNIIRLDDSG
jgi:hypothetical protein